MWAFSAKQTMAGKREENESVLREYGTKIKCFKMKQVQDRTSNNKITKNFIH